MDLGSPGDPPAGDRRSRGRYHSESAAGPRGPAARASRVRQISDRISVAIADSRAEIRPWLAPPDRAPLRLVSRSPSRPPPGRPVGIAVMSTLIGPPAQLS